MSALQEFFELDLTGPEIKIGVIGDAMIDSYYTVKVKKISPEFPIPVMHSDSDYSEDYPGGAANVAYQFKYFNVKSKLISFVDFEAENTFRTKGLNTDLCLQFNNDVFSKNLKVPRKRRFYSDDFPTYRWDVEQPNYGLGKDLESNCLALCEKAKAEIPNFDVVIFSDYDKGVMSSHMQDLLLDCEISIVDPKKDLLRWVGCTVFKPNKQEALALSGCKTVNEAGKYFLNKLQCQAVIITQAGDGVSVFDENGVHEIKPTKKLPPAESVIGAGDCFTAFLAMSMARGLNVREAAEIAWQAGTMYVTNRHNKPISRSDLVRSFDPACDKIIVGCPEDYIGPKFRDYKLVFTNGCFDLGLTIGHVECLKFAKQQGDKLVVAVNGDESVARLKGPKRPIVPIEERIKIIAALQCVDYVVSFNEDTPLEIIKRIKPDLIVKGGDYNPEDVVGKEIAEVKIFNLVNCLSTTEKIDELKL